MTQTLDVQIGSLPGARLIELPYADGELVFDIVLPAEESSLAELERTFDAATLEGGVAALSRSEAIVRLPKLKLAGASFDLARALRKLGIKALFSSAADLSGISGKPGDLVVDSVYHGVFVEVSERGTEAAGATAIAMTRSRKPVIEIDRPFLFLVRDRKSGLVLFLGRVSDPGAEG
jgi:serpin B